MKKQKGFIIPAMIAIVLILTIGGGAYVYSENKKVNKIEMSNKETVTSPVSTDMNTGISTTTAITLPEIDKIQTKSYTEDSGLYSLSYPISWEFKKGNILSVEFKTNPSDTYYKVDVTLREDFDEAVSSVSGILSSEKVTYGSNIFTYFTVPEDSAVFMLPIGRVNNKLSYVSIAIDGYSKTNKKEIEVLLSSLRVNPSKSALIKEAITAFDEAGDIESVIYAIQTQMQGYYFDNKTLEGSCDLSNIKLKGTHLEAMRKKMRIMFPASVITCTTSIDGESFVYSLEKKDGGYACADRNNVILDLKTKPMPTSCLGSKTISIKQDVLSNKEAVSKSDVLVDVDITSVNNIMQNYKTFYEKGDANSLKSFYSNATLNFFSQINRNISITPETKVSFGKIYKSGKNIQVEVIKTKNNANKNTQIYTFIAENKEWKIDINISHEQIAVSKFTKLFFEKVLKNTNGVILFDDRVKLEIGIRNLNDEQLITQWIAFVGSSNIDLAKKNEELLMQSLMSKLII